MLKCIERACFNIRINRFFNQQLKKAEIEFLTEEETRDTSWMNRLDLFFNKGDRNFIEFRRGRLSIDSGGWEETERSPLKYEGVFRVSDNKRIIYLDFGKDSQYFTGPIYAGFVSNLFYLAGGFIDLKDNSFHVSYENIYVPKNEFIKIF